MTASRAHRRVANPDSASVRPSTASCEQYPKHPKTTLCPPLQAGRFRGLSWAGVLAHPAFLRLFVCPTRKRAPQRPAKRCHGTPLDHPGSARGPPHACALLELPVSESVDPLEGQELALGELPAGGPPPQPQQAVAWTTTVNPLVEIAA